MDVLASTPVTLWADFDGSAQGLLIPEAGSVSYSLYDGGGVPMAVAVPLTPEVEATGVSIAIPPIHQVIAPERSFERRHVVVNYVADGRSYQKRLAYRVTELALHSVVPADVRAYLGVNEDELRDDEIDLFSASLTLEALVGKEQLDDALTSGTVREIRAAYAVVLMAAQQLFPSLRYRIAQSKTDGTLKFDRLKDDTAFSGLVQATTDGLLDFSMELGIEPAEVAAPIFIVLGTVSIDPVTGSAPVATNT